MALLLKDFVAEYSVDRIGVGQRQVSKIEHGDLDNAKVGIM